jgi:hypothetical protein
MTAPELASVVDGADYVQFKEIEGTANLREFLAAALGWQPGWVRGLFAARSVLARALRLKTPGPPSVSNLRPQDISFTPGDQLSIFTVTTGEEDHYLVVEAVDRHLTTHLTVVANPVADGRNRFQVGTIVHHHRWTGPLYFALIRPFHHVVLNGMLKAGVQSSG